MFSFLKKTVDDLVADVHTKIDHLHRLADDHAAAATKHTLVAIEHTKLAATASSEYDRAKRIAFKLRDLVA